MTTNQRIIMLKSLNKIDINDYFDNDTVIDVDGKQCKLYFYELTYGGHSCHAVIDSIVYIAYGYENYDGRTFDTKWGEFEKDEE